MKKNIQAIMLVLFSFISLSSAQSSDEAYIAHVLTDVQNAAKLSVDSSSESQKKTFNAYCSLLAKNINIEEVASMVLGRRFSKRGKERACRSGCIWAAADDAQKEKLVKAFHSVLSYKIHGYFTEKLKTQAISIEPAQPSRYKYSTSVAAIFSGGDELNFIVTQLDKPDKRDRNGEYLKRYFQNGPYKTYYDNNNFIFLYDFEIKGVFVREFYQDVYKNLWNGLLGITDAEKVDKIIVSMEKDSLVVDGKVHHCPNPVGFMGFASAN